MEATRTQPRFNSKLIGAALVILQLGYLSGCASTSRTDQPDGADVSIGQEPYGPKPQETYGPAPHLRPPVNLVLGAGVIRGLSHAGVIRALQAIKIPVGAIYATGMGAVVATQYCIKNSVNQMEWGLQKVNENAFSRFSKGIKESVVEDLAGRRLLEQCKTPTVVAIANREDDRVEMRGSGLVSQATLATLFTPVVDVDAIVRLVRNAGSGKTLVVDLSGGSDFQEDGETAILRPDLRGIVDDDPMAKPKAIYAGELAVRKNSERIIEWFMIR